MCVHAICLHTQIPSLGNSEQYSLFLLLGKISYFFFNYSQIVSIPSKAEPLIQDKRCKMGGGKEGAFVLFIKEKAHLVLAKDMRVFIKESVKRYTRHPALSSRKKSRASTALGCSLPPHSTARARERWHASMASGYLCAFS